MAAESTGGAGGGPASGSDAGIALNEAPRRVCLLVGGTGGIGRLAAVQLLAYGGWDVYITGRNAARAEKVAEAVSRDAGVTDASGGNGHSGEAKGRCYGVGPLDLTTKEQVSTFARQWLESKRPIHALLLNAGAEVPGETRTMTGDGIELTVAANHLSFFLLVRLLFPVLRATSGVSRVVSVASFLHNPEGKPFKQPEVHLNFDDLEMADRPYASLLQYSNSKLMNIVFSKELQRRCTAANEPVIAVSMNPGFVPSSDFMRHTSCCVRCITKFCHTCCCKMCGRSTSLEQAASVEAYCCTSSDLEGGEYVEYTMKVASTSAEAADADVQSRLWKWSEERLGLPAAPSDAPVP